MSNATPARLPVGFVALVAAGGSETLRQPVQRRERGRCDVQQADKRRVPERATRELRRHVADTVAAAENRLRVDRGRQAETRREVVHVVLDVGRTGNAGLARNDDLAGCHVEVRDLVVLFCEFRVEIPAEPGVDRQPIGRTAVVLDICADFLRLIVRPDEILRPLRARRQAQQERRERIARASRSRVGGEVAVEREGAARCRTLRPEHLAALEVDARLQRVAAGDVGHAHRALHQVVDDDERNEARITEVDERRDDDSGKPGAVVVDVDAGDAHLLRRVDAEVGMVRRGVVP